MENHFQTKKEDDSLKSSDQGQGALVRSILRMVYLIRVNEHKKSLTRDPYPNPEI